MQILKLRKKTKATGELTFLQETVSLFNIYKACISTSLMYADLLPKIVFAEWSSPKMYLFMSAF